MSNKKSSMLNIQTNKCFSELTTFRRCAPIEAYIKASNLEQLQMALEFAHLRDLPVMTIGSGSNILPLQCGFDGLIVKYQNKNKFYIIHDDNTIEISASNTLLCALKILAFNGIDLSFLAGIPGTLGASVVNNAGVSTLNQAISTYVHSVRVLDIYTNQVKIIKYQDIKFAWRNSIFKTTNNKYIIIDVFFNITYLTIYKKDNQLHPNHKIILNNIKIIKKKRHTKNIEGKNSSGSFFVSQIDEVELLARDYLYKCGYAGFTKNKLCFSDKYLFFRILPDTNVNYSTSDYEIQDFLQNAKDKVQAKYNLTLKMVA